MGRKANKVPVVTEGLEASLVSQDPEVSKGAKDRQDQTETRVCQEGRGHQVIEVMRVLPGQRELKGPEELKEPQETEV